MARDRKNYSYLISILKIISPVLFALFILIANIISKSDLQEGSFKILNDNEYIASFISDTAKAEKSIISDYYCRSAHDSAAVCSCTGICEVCTVFDSLSCHWL